MESLAALIWPAIGFFVAPVAALQDFSVHDALDFSKHSDSKIFWTSTATILTVYAAGCAQIKASGKASGVEAERMRAWFITTYAALLTGFVGLYYTAQIMLTSEASLSLASLESSGSSALCLFFLSYCLCDMVFSFFFYHDQVRVGYRHHTFYAAVCLFLWYTEQTSVFAVFAVEELPTILIGVYRLTDKDLRSIWGPAFFLTRIVYHLYLLFCAARETHVVWFLIGMLILIQHVEFFHQWFINRVRRETRRQNSGGDKSPHYSLTKWTLQTRLLVCALAIMGQIGLHAYLVGGELSVLYVDFGKKKYMYPILRLWFESVGHVAIFAFVTRKLVLMLQQVYEEHFIMHAISSWEIIYNLSWEDPAVERDYLKLGKDDRILTISSAGCNVLDYLCSAPKLIVAADLNCAQLATLDLKLACIKTLDYEKFFKLWGESDVKVFREFYVLKLRPELALEESKKFWDLHGDRLFAENFMFVGTSGVMAKLLGPLIKLGGLKSAMENGATSPPRGLGLAFCRWFLRTQKWILRTMAPLGGVPRAQLDLLEREMHVIVDRIVEIIDKRLWVPDNYFYYGYIVGKFTKKICPRYLKEENFQILKENAGAVIIHHGPLAEAAQREEAKKLGGFTVASLLDSMDWMPDTMIADQVAALVPMMCENSAVFWRSFATKVHSPVLAQLHPTLIPDYDRVGWYLTQYVARVNTPGKKTVGQNLDFSHLTKLGSDYAPKNELLDDLKVVAQLALHSVRKVKDVTEFYRSQGPNYDGFREALLPGRERMNRYCVPWHKVPKTWVSVGCGTARDLEYVVGMVKSCDTKVWLCDLSPALLEIARERVVKLGLEDQIKCVECDITASDEELAKVGLPPMGSVDVVTCSYCLTMIPPWEAALKTMKRMVKTGGSLSLVDFTRRSDAPDSLEQRVNSAWFAMDGVYFSEKHTDALRGDAAFEQTWFHEFESRVPYHFLYPTSYMWCGVKQ